jgi:hypothetical protein
VLHFSCCRQGLLEPPKPKVKLSNLYRVLAQEVRMRLLRASAASMPSLLQQINTQYEI